MGPEPGGDHVQDVPEEAALVEGESGDDGDDVGVDGRCKVKKIEMR